MLKIMRLTGCRVGIPSESGLDRYERHIILLSKFFVTYVCSWPEITTKILNFFSADNFILALT